MKKVEPRTVLWKKGNIEPGEDMEQLFPRKQSPLGSDEIDGGVAVQSKDPVQKGIQEFYFIYDLKSF